MAMLRLLLICLCGVIPIIAAPATGVQMASLSVIYNNNNNNSVSSNSLVSSYTSPSLNNSTTTHGFIPPDPCARETSAGGMVVFSKYKSASRLDPSGWEADIGGVLAQAQAEAVEHTAGSVLPQRLVYVEEHAFLYVKPLMLGVTWAIWSAALEQITLFHRHYKDFTFYFQIVQPSRAGASVTLVVADGQLRVL